MVLRHHFVHIVDDDPALRHTLELILSRAEIPARFYDNSSDFLEAAPGLPAGCVLLDYWMPPPSGKEVQHRLRRMRYDLPVIVMTGKSDVATAVAAMKAGAVDFLEKPFDYNRLIATISGTLKTLDNAPRADEVGTAVQKIAMLSKREREVLEAFESGMTTKKAAYMLGVSIRTIEAHRARMLERLGVKSLAQAVRLSVTARLGLPYPLAS